MFRTYRQQQKKQVQQEEQRQLLQQRCGRLPVVSDAYMYQVLYVVLLLLYLVLTTGTGLL